MAQESAIDSNSSSGRPNSASKSVSSCSLIIEAQDKIGIVGISQGSSNSTTINQRVQTGEEDSNAPPGAFLGATLQATKEQQTELNESTITTDALYQLVKASSRCCDDNLGECCQQLNLGEPKIELALLYNDCRRLKLKDFSSEVRASMDVEQFVHQAELMIDLSAVSVEDIVEIMLERVISNEKAPASILAEAKEAIFVPGSSMMMAHTIQGVTALVDDGSNCQVALAGNLIHDQSWLCALCKLASIGRRHMIIARFKQPTNMGKNAHEVRLFVLIVTPSKEKGTKNALETGRTFATMLTDADFKIRLLEARDHIEFKSLMMIRAQQLSKAKAMKNRHKYMIDPLVGNSITSLEISATDLDQAYMGSSPYRALSRKFEMTSKQRCSSTDCGGGNNANMNSRGRKSDGNLIGDKSERQHSCSSLFARNPHTSGLLELIAQVSKKDETIANDVGAQKVDLGLIAGGAQYDPGSETKMTKITRANSSCCCCPGLAKLLKHVEFGNSLWADFRRRARYYPSDFKDAFVGPPNTLQKTVATIWFLYFGILLPTIAFSALNSAQTDGHMGDLRKALIGQAIGGLCFALFGGQPLVIIMTTAPLCLYTRVIHQMCLDYGFNFLAMYAAVGLWNGFFLVIYSIFGFSKLMKWCTRSTEEIFALFIVIAFISDAAKEMKKNFNHYYYAPACQSISQTTLNASMTLLNSATSSITNEEASVCRRDTSLLFLLLMLGTLWLATTLYRFNKTPYLEASKRELLADYALPVAVITMSFVGSYVFDDIFVEKFPALKSIEFVKADLELLPLSGILTSLGLGFTLSLLFFMDQNISAAMVNAPQNRLKKGCAYHFDLLVVGLLNVFLTLYGFPMMHGVLPHSPLHVRSLADIEERVEEGHLRTVIANVRETRVTGIVSHILLLASLLLIPYPIAYVPTAVLNGLFLYMAVTSLEGLQMFERILLLFTEQSKYPPNHYIRRCPQRNIHKFTMLQLFQLLVMCIFGFSPFNTVEMFFPVIILLMIPFRHKFVPKYVEEKYLAALDGKHG